MVEKEPFVVECKTAQEANRMNLEVYRFEKLDSDRGYVFIRRGGK